MFGEVIDATKGEQTMKKKCSICGCGYRNTLAFKNGFVCENCLGYLREQFHSSKRS